MKGEWGLEGVGAQGGWVGGKNSNARKRDEKAV